MVVLTIIGILATVVIVTMFGSDHSNLVRSEADRMIRTLELARREATMRNELWGVVLERDEYEFVQFNFDSEEWSVIERRPYVGNQLEQDLQIVFTTPEDIYNEGAGNEGEMPEIVIQPSGEITPFEIEIEHITSFVSTAFGTDGLAQIQLFAEVEPDFESSDLDFVQ